MGKLDGRVILVTGASRGIGLAIARLLAEEGGRLILVARDRRTLARASAEVPRGPLIVRADVTRPGDIARLFRHVRRRFGRLDVLINSAGVFVYKLFTRTTLKDWQSQMETNLTSLFLIIRAALPLLERSKAPHIVNILSVSSREAFPKCSAYCASKFGALGLTRVLAEEFRPKRIRVTAILPGSTDTRMKNAFDFPVRRAKLLQPQDVADAVLSALAQPARASVEEILIMPSRGSL